MQQIFSAFTTSASDLLNFDICSLWKHQPSISGGPTFLKVRDLLKLKQMHGSLLSPLAAYKTFYQH